MVDIQGLSFYYNQNKTLFNDLELKLQPGNIYGLLGKNGAGKTTLLKLIAGLLFPQKGKCQIFGMDAQKRLPEVLENIYFLSEDFALPTLTIAEYLKLYAPFYSKFDHPWFQKTSEKFDLNNQQNLAQLSYGQKKKFLLTFGIATQAQLLLLDEPTNGLDIPSKSQFRQLLASSLTPERIFVIATHQVRDMENLIDPIIIVDDGKIIFNSDLASIAKRFWFTTTNDELMIKSALYVEKSLNGYHIILSNLHQEESSINLEFLFNAVTSCREKMWQLKEQKL